MKRFRTKPVVVDQAHACDAAEAMMKIWPVDSTVYEVAAQFLELVYITEHSSGIIGGALCDGNQMVCWDKLRARGLIQ